MYLKPCLGNVKINLSKTHVVESHLQRDYVCLRLVNIRISYLYLPQTFT